jgi:hypothetical protein
MSGADAKAGDEGFLVNAVGAVFQALRALSPLSILNWLVLRHFDRGVRVAAVDTWIILNFLAAFAAGLAVALALPVTPGLAIAVGVWAAWRLYEIIIVQINVLLFDPYFHRRAFLAGKVSEPYRLRGRYRLVVALMANFIEIALWYAAAYFHLHKLGQLKIDGPNPEGLAGLALLFQQCLRALVTFDVSQFVAASGTLAFVLVIMQSFIGMFMTIVMLARFVSLLPAPQAESDPRD